MHANFKDTLGSGMKKSDGGASEKAVVREDEGSVAYEFWSWSTMESSSSRAGIPAGGDGVSSVMVMGGILIDI